MTELLRSKYYLNNFHNSIIYQSFGTNTPYIAVIDFDSSLPSEGLALGKYMVLFLESEQEYQNFEEDYKRAKTYDFFWERPSVIDPNDCFIATYHPEAAGWPWLFVCCLPASEECDPISRDYSRGRYAFDVFETEQELHSHIDKTISRLHKSTHRFRWIHMPELALPALEISSASSE